MTDTYIFWGVYITRLIRFNRTVVHHLWLTQAWPQISDLLHLLSSQRFKQFQWYADVYFPTLKNGWQIIEGGCQLCLKNR